MTKTNAKFVATSKKATATQLVTFPNVLRQMYAGITEEQRKVIRELSGIDDFALATAKESVKTLRKRVLTNHNTATTTDNKVIFVNKRNIYYSVGADGDVLKGYHYAQTVNYNDIIHRAASNTVRGIECAHNCVVGVIYDVGANIINSDDVHIWRKVTDKLGAESYEYKGKFTASAVADDDNGYIAAPRMIEG